MESLLREYGGWAILLGTAIEGDATMILAGVLAHVGLVSPGRAFVVGVALLGDTAYYTMGRLFERRARHTRAFEKVAPLVERFARRLGPLTIFASRFVYGTRTATMIFWGVRRLGWGRFALIDLAGCVTCAALLGGLGYLFSGVAGQLLGGLRRAEKALILAVGVIAPLVWAAHRWMVRRERRLSAASMDAEDPAQRRE